MEIESLKKPILAATAASDVPIFIPDNEEGKEEPIFIPAKEREGVKPGYTYKDGSKGFGYYIDGIVEFPKSLNGEVLFNIYSDAERTTSALAFNPLNKSYSEVQDLDKWYCVQMAVMKWKHQFPIPSDTALWEGKRGQGKRGKVNLQEALKTLDKPPPPATVEMFEKLIIKINENLENVYINTRSDTVVNGVYFEYDPKKHYRDISSIKFQRICTAIVQPIACGLIYLVGLLCIPTLGEAINDCNCGGCNCNLCCCCEKKEQPDVLPLRFNPKLSEIDNYGFLFVCCKSLWCVHCTQDCLCKDIPIGNFNASHLYRKYMNNIATLLNDFNETNEFYHVEWIGDEKLFQASHLHSKLPEAFFEIKFRRLPIIKGSPETLDMMR
jgi:hypothetical protein